jgi:hypothetical protein
VSILNKQSRTAEKGWYSVLIMLRNIQRSLGIRLVAGSCECDDEPSGSIKCGEFLE